MIEAVYKYAGGQGADLVLIHGFASDRLSWAANVSQLTGVARVHVVDLPGHGEASADVGDGSVAMLAASVKLALQANGVTKAHVLGHSLGGAIALHLAAHEPEFVCSLALIAPAGLGTGIDFDFVKGLAAATEIDPTLALLRQLVVKPQMINKLLAKRLIDHLAKPGMREALLKIATQLHRAEAHEIADLLPRLSPALPIYVMWGAQDHINPVATDTIKKLGASYHVIEDAGHMPHIEKAEIANAALTQFLQGLS